MTDLTEPVLWYVARASGLVSLLLLTVSVLLGIASGARGPVLPRFVTQRLHRASALTGVLLLVVHVVAVVVDPYVSLNWYDVWWPFAADDQRLWTGLGTLAVDLLVLVVATSIVRHRVGARAWRRIHLTAYAVYALSIGHGVGIGTDSLTPWAAAMTATSAGLALAALGVRVRRDRDRRGKRYNAELEVPT